MAIAQHNADPFTSPYSPTFTLSPSVSPPQDFHLIFKGKIKVKKIKGLKLNIKSASIFFLLTFLI
jgi:hypothetical protein